MTFPYLTGMERDSNGVIQLIDTTDIGKSLEKYSDRWAQALERTLREGDEPDASAKEQADEEEGDGIAH